MFVIRDTKTLRHSLRLSSPTSLERMPLYKTTRIFYLSNPQHRQPLGLGLLLYSLLRLELSKDRL